MQRTESLIPAERIEQAILLLRGERVLLDRDLAALYGVSTRFSIKPFNAIGSGFPMTSCFN
jgi:hypothetical protein